MLGKTFKIVASGLVTITGFGLLARAFVKQTGKTAEAIQEAKEEVQKNKESDKEDSE